MSLKKIPIGKKPSTIEMQPKTRAFLGPADFIKVSNKQGANIRSSKYVPPRIGSKHFGFFEVEFNQPVYDTDLDVRR